MVQREAITNGILPLKIFEVPKQSFKSQSCRTEFLIFWGDWQRAVAYYLPSDTLKKYFYAS